MNIGSEAATIATHTGMWRRRTAGWSGPATRGSSRVVIGISIKKALNDYLLSDRK